MKYLIIATLFLLPVTVLAQDGNIASVKMRNGSFEFSDFRVEGGASYSLKLYVTVTNKTGHDWTIVSFKLIPYDQAGNAMPEATSLLMEFHVYGIADGQTRRIDGANIMYTGQTKISRFGIKFSDGSMPIAYDVVMVKPVPSRDMRFEDGVIQAQWVFDPKQIGFVLRNKTDNPIKVDWNQISYVDATGTAEKIMHNDVKFTSRNEPQPPTTIPPTAKIEDFVFPSANAYYETGRYGGWRETPMFPNSEDGLLYKGKTFSVFMPLEINGAVKNYTFTFMIQDVRFSKLPEGAGSHKQEAASSIGSPPATRGNVSAPVSTSKQKVCYDSTLSILGL